MKNTQSFEEFVSAWIERNFNEYRSTHCAGSVAERAKKIKKDFNNYFSTVNMFLINTNDDYSQNFRENVLLTSVDDLNTYIRENIIEQLLSHDDAEFYRKELETKYSEIYCIFH